MKNCPVAALATFLFFAAEPVTAEIVSITTTGKVTLSEIDTFADEDTITGSFSYHTSSEGETFTTDDGSLTETLYTGITASFRNSSGTFAVKTKDAKIIITRVSTNSTFHTPRHELRLFFPDADIPAGGTKKYPAFIGFLSFSDRTLSALKDGKLPATLDHSSFQSMRFLFAWNRKPGDEAPLEYGGQLLPSQDSVELDLTIRPAGELTFTARSGFIFQIEYSDDLQSWFPFGDAIQGDGSNVSRFVSTVDMPSRNFRVRTISKDK